jgi:hypothetical protein
MPAVTFSHSTSTTAHKSMTVLRRYFREESLFNENAALVVGLCRLVVEAVWRTYHGGSVRRRGVFQCLR